MVAELQSALRSPFMPSEDYLSYEEFLRQTDGQFVEWVDGKVIHMTTSLPHQQLSYFLSRILGDWVEAHDLGEIITAPFQMRLQRSARGREPDILFVRKERLEQLERLYLDGPADLAIEIISPESVLRDRGEKYAEYELEGVREYWIIDRDGARTDFFVLNEQNRYDRALPDDAGFYHSAVLDGFRLPVEWLWQTPLPKLRDARRALGIE